MPTNAQFEYACKAGTTTLFHNGGNSIKNLSLVGCNTTWISGGVLVGCYSPNLWGIYDTIGVIYEWCRDWAGDVSADPVVDPCGPVTGTCRVMRPDPNQTYLNSDNMGSRLPNESKFSSYSPYGFRVVIEQ